MRATRSSEPIGWPGERESSAQVEHVYTYIEQRKKYRYITVLYLQSSNSKSTTIKNRQLPRRVGSGFPLASYPHSLNHKRPSRNWNMRRSMLVLCRDSSDNSVLWCGNSTKSGNSNPWYSKWQMTVPESSLQPMAEKWTIITYNERVSEWITAL